MHPINNSLTQFPRQRISQLRKRSAVTLIFQLQCLVLIFIGIYFQIKHIILSINETYHHWFRSIHKYNLSMRALSIISSEITQLHLWSIFKEEQILELWSVDFSKTLKFNQRIYSHHSSHRVRPLLKNYFVLWWTPIVKEIEKYWNKVFQP